tara:strand:- start:345 stop:524 length:180 start_codon:yes stop_codon:yes gene_type:complete
MKNVIKKLDNGDFKVVSTSYDTPVVYNDNRMWNRVERRWISDNTSRYSFKYSFYRSNGD